MLRVATSALAFTSVFAKTERWTEHDDCGSETQTCWAWEYCPEGYSVTWQKWSWECFSQIDGCKYEDCVAPGGCRVDLYEDHDGEGLKSVKFTPGSYNLVGGADIVSSVRLTGNNCKLEVFEFAGGQGRSLVMTEPKLYNMNGAMDNAIKSMKLTVRASVDRRLTRRIDDTLFSAMAALEEAAKKMQNGDGQAAPAAKDWSSVMAYPDVSNGMLQKSEDEAPQEDDNAQSMQQSTAVGSTADGESHAHGDGYYSEGELDLQGDGIYRGVKKVIPDYRLSAPKKRVQVAMENGPHGDGYYSEGRLDLQGDGIYRKEGEDGSKGVPEVRQYQAAPKRQDAQAGAIDTKSKALAELMAAAAMKKEEAMPVVEPEMPEPEDSKPAVETPQADLYKQALEQLTAASEKKGAQKTANSAATAEKAATPAAGGGGGFQAALEQLAKMMQSGFNNN